MGKELRLRLARKSLAIAIALPLLSVASVFITHFVILQDKTDTFGAKFILQIAPYCHLDTLTYMLGAFWYMQCECLSKAAAVLAEDFQKVSKRRE